MGVATVLGTAARKELQRSLLRRFGRNLTTMGPLLTGAAVAGYLNRRATRTPGRPHPKDLQQKPARGGHRVLLGRPRRAASRAVASSTGCRVLITQ